MPIKYADMNPEQQGEMMARDAGITTEDIAAMQSRVLELDAAGYPHDWSCIHAVMEFQVGRRLDDIPGPEFFRDFGRKFG